MAHQGQTMAAKKKASSGEDLTALPGVGAATAKKLHMPMERVVITLDKTGNTSAASVPIALDWAVKDGRIKRGQKLLLEAFGGGFAWGSALVQY